MFPMLISTLVFFFFVNFCINKIMIPPQVTRLVYGLLNAAINVAYYRYFVVDIVMYEILNFQFATLSS